jgi:hypothetical protein
MKLADKDLREYYRETLEKGVCPEKEIFIKAFLNEITEEEKMKLIDHILICDRCATEFEALREVTKKTKEKIEGLERKELAQDELKKIAKQRIKQLKKEARERWFNRFTIKIIPAKYVALLAVLIIVILAYFLILKSPGIFKKTGEYREIIKVELQLIEPLGEISKFPSVFKWTIGEKAKYYNFELTDSKLNIVWAKENITTTSLKLPQNIKENLQKGKTYFWKVTVFDELNQKMKSALQYFEIK